MLMLVLPKSSHAELHSTLTLTTNNVGRWFTKNHNSIGVQANADYQHPSGLFLGTTLSTVDFATYSLPGTANVEIIPYAGWAYTFSDKWRLDGQWSRYLYDSNVFGHQADYNEFYLFLHYRDIFSGRISFAEDYYGLGNYALDYELTAKYPFFDNLEGSASFGYAQTKAALGSDYPYWNAGVTYFHKPFALDLRYMDATETSIDPYVVDIMHERYDPQLLNSTLVFSISLGF